MLYLAVCIANKAIPSMAKSDDIPEWVQICKDQLLQKKCKVIRCYEPIDNNPHTLFLVIDTDQPDAIDIISRDLGKEWHMELYPLHRVHEFIEEDHSIVAG